MKEKEEVKKREVKENKKTKEKKKKKVKGAYKVIQDAEQESDAGIFSSIFLKLIIIIFVIFLAVFGVVSIITTRNFNEYFIDHIVKPWLSQMSNISESLLQEELDSIEGSINKQLSKVTSINFSYPPNFNTYTKLKGLSSEDPEKKFAIQYFDKIDQISKNLKNEASSNPYLKKIYLIDLNGMVIASSDSTLRGENLAETEIYKAVSSKDQKVLLAKKDTVSDGVTGYMGLPFFHKDFLNSKITIVSEFNLSSMLKGIVGNGKRLDEKLSLFLQDKTVNKFLYNQRYPEYIYSNNTQVNKLASSLQLAEKIEGTNEVFTSNIKGYFYQFIDIKDTNWIIGYSYSKVDFDSSSQGIIKTLIILGVLSLILTIISVLLTVYNVILKKINSFIYVMHKVSDGDLTQNVLAFGSDEISAMGTALNKFLESIRKSWSIVLKRVKELEHSEIGLDKSISASVKGIERITYNVKESKEHIEKQTYHVSETSTAVEEIARNLDSLNKLVEEQSENVDQSSTSIEELIANIKSITELTEETNKQVISLSKLSNEGHAHQNEMISQITVIAQVSEQLHEANSLIASMADQTNLLSMNAAIEAAHAGEAGKGFAVVAEEIRGLAEQVSEQSESVSQTVYQIQESIDQVVKSTEISSESFNNLIAQMTRVANYILQIQEMMQSQSQGTRQILHSITELKNISQNVKIGSKEIADGNKQILEAITSLSDVNAKVKDLGNELFNDVREILYKVQDIKESSINNKNSLKDIKNLRHKFYTGESSEN